MGLLSFKGNAQEIATKKTNTEFDFSTIEKYRHSKSIGQIVSDYDNVFNSNQRKELSKIIFEYNKKTTRQIAVVTVDSISPYDDIHRFATDLARYWGVGTAEKDNGLVIVLCNPCRQIGIATGTGTEKVLTNEICTKVIRETIIPELKKGEFYSGIKYGVIELIKYWK